MTPVDFLEKLGYKEQIIKLIIKNNHVLKKIALRVDDSIEINTVSCINQSINFDKPLDSVIGTLFLSIFQKRLYYSPRQNCFLLMVLKPGITGGYSFRYLSKKFVRRQIFTFLENATNTYFAFLLTSSVLRYIKGN